MCAVPQDSVPETKQSLLIWVSRAALPGPTLTLLFQDVVAAIIPPADVIIWSRLGESRHLLSAKRSVAGL